MIGLATTTPTSTPGGWLPAAMGSSLGVATLVIAVASLVIITLIALMLRRLPRRPVRLRLRQLLAGESGTATLEFALVMPLLLFFSLLLVQTMYVAVGNIYIHYAAYAAARSAIVTIPGDWSELGEGPNVVSYPGSAKHEHIRLASVMAILPVAGRLSASAAPADTLADDVYEGLLVHYGGDAPRWVETIVPDAYRYADVNTHVQLLRVDPDVVVDQPDLITFVRVDPEQYADVRFGPKEPITVQVAHRLTLRIPLASALFAGYGDGEYLHDGGTGSGYYRWVDASCTLINEGMFAKSPEAPTTWDPNSGQWVPLPRKEPEDRR